MNKEPAELIEKNLKFIKRAIKSKIDIYSLDFKTTFRKFLEELKDNDYETIRKIPETCEFETYLLDLIKKFLIEQGYFFKKKEDEDFIKRVVTEELKLYKLPLSFCPEIVNYVKEKIEEGKLKKLKGFQEKCKFKTFLFIVIGRLVIDYVRKYKKIKVSEETSLDIDKFQIIPGPLPAKPQRDEISSKIASPVQTYPAPSPTPLTQPEPEPSQKSETPAPESVKEKIPFSFTKKEKTWLITTTAKPLPLTGESAEWAGFTMLYSLFYWESELDSLKELGIMPSFQREYDRLFNVTNDLLRLVTEATTQQPIREFKEQEKQSPGFTGQTAFDFINRFSNSWRYIPKYFPWHQFTANQISLMLGKLRELLHRLKNILADIQALKKEALKPLGEFLRDISPLVNLMARLSDYAYELNKPEPIPLYVSGEIKEITDDSLVVTIEHSSREDQKWTISRLDFPEEKPQVGQRFFGVIKQEQPDKLVEIEPMSVREEKSFDELFISLFGKEAYEVVSARWKEEEKDTS